MLAVFVVFLSLASALNFIACKSEVVTPLNNSSSKFPMTAEICNNLVAGVYPYFQVNNASCKGVSEAAFAALTPLSTIPCPVITPYQSGEFPTSYALYNTTLQPQAGFYSTGFFGGDLSEIPSPDWVTLNKTMTALYFNYYQWRITDLYIEFDHQPPPGVNVTTLETYNFAPSDCITNFSLSFYTPLGPDINGYVFELSNGTRGQGGNLTNVRSALPLGVQGKFCLKSLFSKQTLNQTVMVAFSWSPKPGPPEQSCVNDNTKLRTFGINDDRWVNASCEAQLALVLTENQKGFSWVLLGLLAAALADRKSVV